MLLVIAALAASPPSSAAHADARASVRIERPITVSAAGWDRLPKSKRSERIVRDEQGRLVLLRLVECE